MNPINPTRLRRKERETVKRLTTAWAVAGTFLVVAFVLLAVVKFAL